MRVLGKEEEKKGQEKELQLTITGFKETCLIKPHYFRDGRDHALPREILPPGSKLMQTSQLVKATAGHFYISPKSPFPF